MYKRRLDQKGMVIPDTIEKHKVGPELDDKLKHKSNETECGSCYGAAPEDECCNSCDEVSLHNKLDQRAPFLDISTGCSCSFDMQMLSVLLTFDSLVNELICERLSKGLRTFS